MLKKALFLLCSGKTEKKLYGRYKVTVGEYTVTTGLSSYKVVDGIRYDIVSLTHRGYLVRNYPYGAVEIGTYNLLEGEDLTSACLCGAIKSYGGLIDNDFDTEVSVNPNICGHEVILVNETNGKEVVLKSSIYAGTGELTGNYSDVVGEVSFFEGIETGQDCTVAVYYYKKG